MAEVGRFGFPVRGIFGWMALGCLLGGSSEVRANGVGAWVRAQAALANMQQVNVDLDALSRKRSVRRSSAAAACLKSNRVSVGVFLEIAEAAQSQIAEAAAVGDDAQVSRSWRTVVEVEAQVRKIGEAPLSCPYVGGIAEDGNRLVSKPVKK
jgi:hypothetical protein